MLCNLDFGFVILETAQGPNPSFFLFLGGLLFNLGACWDKGLRLGLGPGLDNYADLKGRDL